MALIVAIAFTMIIVPTVSGAAVNAQLRFVSAGDEGEHGPLYGKTADEKVRIVNSEVYYVY